MSRPPTLPPLPTVSTSGIEQLPTGERKVASTRRPDGTLRKELKIRPGYTPEEDVSKFRTTRGAEQAAREKVKGSIPGLPPPGGAVAAALAGMSKSQKRNVKRKEKKGGKDDEDEDVPESWDADEEDALTGGKDAKAEVTTKTSPVAPPPPPVVEDSKRVKALKKKLRQAELLKERDTLGLYLPPAERAKIKGIPDLEEEIAKLSLNGSEDGGKADA